MKHRDYTDYLNDILDSIRDAIEFKNQCLLMNFSLTKRQVMLSSEALR